MLWIVIALGLMFLGTKVGRKLIKFTIQLIATAALIFFVYNKCVDSLNGVFDGDTEARDKAIASMVEQAKDKEAWKEIADSAIDDYKGSPMDSSVSATFSDFLDTFNSK